MKVTGNRYMKETLAEPLILEPEDWAPDEWATFCKLCALPVGQTERIVLHVETMESFVDQTKAVKAPDRTYIVTEMCPHCESEIEMRWNTDALGFKAFCPVCGQRLMLCDECRHAENFGPCDYRSDLDCCHHNSPMPAVPKPREVSAITLRVETPLGAIIARSTTDPDHPGICIDLRRGVDDPDMPLALVEFAADEADLPEVLITRVWGDAMQEDYTTRVDHQNVEQYFTAEEVP